MAVLGGEMNVSVDENHDSNAADNCRMTDGVNGDLAGTSAGGVEIFDLSRVCGVGDSLDHDIEGARRAGISSIWTANGVHCAEMGTEEGSTVLADEKILQEMFLKYGITPTHTIASFHW